MQIHHLAGWLRRVSVLVVLSVLVSSLTLLVPVVDVADSSTPPVKVYEDKLADGVVERGWAETVRADANLVAVKWRGDPAAKFAIERRGRNGEWRPVTTVGIIDVLPDPGSADDRSSRRRGDAVLNASDPVWVGDAAAVRVRLVTGEVTDPVLDRVVAPAPKARPGAASAAVPQKPGIVSRAGWGADESFRVQNCPSGPDYDARVQAAVIHHTVTSNDYGPADAPQLIRSIYAYHTQSLGYCDIAYNFIVDRFGTVYEGRFGGVAEPVHGAHSIGFNTATTGIALLGDFTAAQPTAAQLSAVKGLVAWKLAIHNVNPAGSVAYVTTGNAKFAPGVVPMPTVVGHRDTWFTICPGAGVYNRMGEIRAGASAIQAAAPPAGWRGWEPLGGVLQSEPAVASWEPGRLDTFVLGTDGRIWQRTYSNGWSGWQPLGGSVVSAPAAVSWGPGRLDVFARDGDNTLWHRWFDGTGWHGPESLGGQLSSAPAVASWTNGRLDVFARGPGGDVIHRYYDGAWSPWESLGGSISNAPAAVSWVSGRLDVFVRGAGDQLYHRWYQGTWSAWESLGGVLSATPAVASWAEGRLDVFVRGSDNALWHGWYSGDWNLWEDQSGTLASGPAAVSWQPSRVDVFARGTDQQMWHKWYG